MIGSKSVGKDKLQKYLSVTDRDRFGEIATDNTALPRCTDGLVSLSPLRDMSPLHTRASKAFAQGVSKDPIIHGDMAGIAKVLTSGWLTA